jgi:hypothetical protein
MKRLVKLGEVSGGACSNPIQPGIIRGMAREPKRTKGGTDLVKITVMLTGDDLAAIDKEAERLTRDDELQRHVTRTDVVKLWLRRGREASKR